MRRSSLGRLIRMPNRVYRPNPYRPGTGRRPPLLAGRDGAIEEFELALAEPESG